MAGKKWKDILADQAIPDDFAISVNGETMTLGAMREYDRESKGALSQQLSAREAEMVKREKLVNDASVGMATMLERVGQATGLTPDELLQGKMPTKKEVAKAVETDENDPIVGSLVKDIKALRAEIQQGNARYEELRKNALGPMLNTYLDDYYELQWERLHGQVPEGSKLERQAALDYAQKNGIKDAKGRWDLGKAIRDLTYDDRVKAEAKKLAAAETKKMQDEMTLRSVQRPSQLGQKVKPDKSVLNEKGQVKNFDEVLNDAVNDADLWRGLAAQGNQVQ
jgi:hypothetical protein